MSRYDIVLGHYVFCLLHHKGQWSPLYARLFRITGYFFPGRLFSETKFLDPSNEEYVEAMEVYYHLCRKHKVKV